jgi:O-antigen ligase
MGAGGSPTGLDLAGCGLFLLAAGWVMWARVQSGGSARPGIGLICACGAVIIAVRMLGPRARLVVPAALLIVAFLVLAGSRSSIFSAAPLAGPLEYTNADGAFYLQASVAALVLASTVRWRLIKAGGYAVAVAFGMLPLIVHAAAAAWLVLTLPVIAIGSSVVGRAKGPRLAIGLFGLLFGTCLAITIVLGATGLAGDPSPLLRRAAIETVDRERVALWHDAFVIMQTHPGTGVGPGRYQLVSAIGSRDRDLRWAHNEFLQQGAEGGVVGLVLLVSLFTWGFGRLLLVDGPDTVTALAAASLAALGIHASIDYIMHFPAIPIMSASLVATGMTGRPGIISMSRSDRFVENDDLAQTRSHS